MTIPIYDINTMPCITYPMKNTQVQTKKYLGGKARTQQVDIVINIMAKSDAEMLALYTFWKTECNYGLEPFLLPLPIFGETFNPAAPHILAKFNGDISVDKTGAVWEASMNILVLGTIDYIIDDFGNFIVSDTGEYMVDANDNYVATGNIVNSYREVLYGA